MRNPVSDQASSWQYLMQRSFLNWSMKRQYPMKSPRAANWLRIRRRQLCIKWQVGALGMSFYIRWTSKRKSATLRTMVLGLFDYRLMKHHTISTRFKQKFLLDQSKTSTASRRNLSTEGLVKIPPSVHVCPGSRPVGVCNYGKGTTTPWRSVSIGISSLDTGKMETFKP